MRFKTKRQEAEFKELDPRIRAIFLELDWRFGGDDGLMITHIKRTPEEQQMFYPANPTKPSPHLDNPVRAIDIRNSDMDKETQLAIVNYFNEWWPEHVILLNDRGTGSPHIHIAVRKKDA